MIAVPPRLTFAVLLAGILIGAAQAQTLRYLGQQILPHAYPFAETTIGGLSGLDYDPVSRRFVAISDDRSYRQPARFYTLELDLAAFTTHEPPGSGGLRFTGVTTLKTAGGATHAQGTVDPESIRQSLAPGRLLWVSEGDARKGIPPAIEEIDADGAPLRRFEIPAHFLPTPERGVRDNLAFESLAVDAAAARLYVGTENALRQDGPPADVGQPSVSRILVYDWRTGRRLAEHAYRVDAVPVPPPLPLLFRTNGLVELLAGDGVMLALERAYTQGVGNSVRLYRLDLSAASDVSGLETLAGADYVPVAKTLLLDLGTLGVAPDNLEGMSWGPRLANGHRTLVLVADDNFSARQHAQWLAFEWIEADPGMPDGTAPAPVARER